MTVDEYSILTVGTLRNQNAESDKFQPLSPRLEYSNTNTQSLAFLYIEYILNPYNQIQISAVRLTFHSRIRIRSIFLFYQQEAYFCIQNKTPYNFVNIKRMCIFINVYIRYLCQNNKCCSVSQQNLVLLRYFYQKIYNI